MNTFLHYSSLLWTVKYSLGTDSLIVHPFLYLIVMIITQCDSDFFHTQVHFINSNINIENYISSIFSTGGYVLFRNQDLLLMNGFCNYFLSCPTYSTKNSLYNCSAMFSLVLLHLAFVHVAEWKTKAVIVPQHLLKLGKIDHKLLLCPLSV